MNIERRIKAFSKLGRFLKVVADSDITVYDKSLKISDYNEFRKLIKNSYLKNDWFTGRM